MCYRWYKLRSLCTRHWLYLKALTWSPHPMTLELECFCKRQCKRSLSIVAWLILLANLTLLEGRNLSWRSVSIFRNTCGNIFLIAVWGKRAQSTVGGPLPRQLGQGCIKGEPVSNPVNRGPLWFLLYLSFLHRWCSCRWKRAPYCQVAFGHSVYHRNRKQIKTRF